MAKLKSYYDRKLCEAGCDEAGRGCLAGPVFAAAVIFPKNYKNNKINDSKQLNLQRRQEMRKMIESDAMAYAVAMLDNTEIDQLNILRASIMAMHKAVDKLKMAPDLLLIDGNRFYPYKETPHHCIVKGDAKFLSIAAASILAKTYRDDYMLEIHNQHPQYCWDKNKGYPTAAHRAAIVQHGVTQYHRKTFKLLPDQLSLNLV